MINEAWHLDRDKIFMLAHWLDGHDYFGEACNVLEFIEKHAALKRATKWTRTRQLWLWNLG